MNYSENTPLMPSESFGSTSLLHKEHQGRRVLVIYNPTAGGRRRRRFDKTLELLTARDCAIQTRRTQKAGDAETFARLAKQDDCDLIVAAGGDGTINEVINGLVNSSNNLPLAILPLGTANVLAKEIGLGLSAKAIAETIALAPARPVNLGQITHLNRNRENQTRIFSLMAGAGFDAHVVAGTSLPLKRRIGKGAYVVESLRQLVVFPFSSYRVVVDGVAHAAASVVVTKARHYAGPYVLAPDANLESPQLHVCLFQRPGIWNTVRYALALQRGHLPSLPDYQIICGQKVTIEGPRQDPLPEPLQGDGDLVAELPVTISLLPKALNLVMPVTG